MKIVAGFVIPINLVGIIFGVPGGAIGALTVQRTFHYGSRAGLLTGLGFPADSIMFFFSGSGSCLRNSSLTPINRIKEPPAI